MNIHDKSISGLYSGPWYLFIRSPVPNCLHYWSVSRNLKSGSARPPHFFNCLHSCFGCFRPFAFPYELSNQLVSLHKNSCWHSDGKFFHIFYANDYFIHQLRQTYFFLYDLYVSYFFLSYLVAHLGPPSGTTNTDGESVHSCLAFYLEEESVHCFFITYDVNYRLILDVLFQSWGNYFYSYFSKIF